MIATPSGKLYKGEGVRKLKRQYIKLTKEERDLLAIWKAQGVSNKVCARRLRRTPSTIGRELKRNRWRDHYVAIHAQSLADERQQKSAHGKKPLKNAQVYSYVTDKLRDSWSPDQIAGRLKGNHPYNSSWWITAETIYRWIYQPEQIQQETPWYEYLRRKQKRRRKQTGRSVNRIRIPDRVSISKRPEAVNKREQFGHWEADSIIGKGRKNGLHTEVERVSRYIQAYRIRRINADETVMAQRKIFTHLPSHARRSTTADNGLEFIKHQSFELPVYFAHPYSSWERGTNEHGNWHIRYYFPKGTDFNDITNEELHDVIEEINNRPRKILGYRTSREVFMKHLKQDQTISGVAIDS
ncbi:MAG TPA: IS30 family transposase [Patescibacteria group bacterium]|nr:IS30 family transposase [Patescibacteria group bacterium]